MATPREQQEGVLQVRYQEKRFKVHPKCAVTKMYLHLSAHLTFFDHLKSSNLISNTGYKCYVKWNTALWGGDGRTFRSLTFHLCSLSHQNIRQFLFFCFCLLLFTPTNESFHLRYSHLYETVLDLIKDTIKSNFSPLLLIWHLASV